MLILGQVSPYVGSLTRDHQAWPAPRDVANAHEETTLDVQAYGLRVTPAQPALTAVAFETKQEPPSWVNSQNLEK